MSMMLRRAMMVPAVVPGGLPSEYLQVEYLESTNDTGQYIDTGFSPTNSTRCVGKANFPVMKAYQAVFGTYSNYFCLIRNSNKDMYIAQIKRADTQINIPITAVDHEFDINTTRAIVDNVEYSVTAGESSIQGVLWLFAKSNNVSQTNIDVKGSCRIYYFKVYEGETLARDFVPCIRISDSKPGMYDLVGGTFYTNAGTGEFIAGLAPELSDTGFWSINGYFAGNGSITLDNGYRMCDYMPIVAGNEYKMSTSNAVWNGIGFYNESYTSVDFAQNNSGTISKTAPANAKYYRIYTTETAQGIKFELVNPT